MAATLWLGDESAISHLTGATLLRLDGCRTTELHASVPRSVRRRAPQPDICIHRVSSLPRSDRVLVDGIPCTSATRTILDCGRVLGSEALEVAFESARRMGLSSVAALHQRAAELGTGGRRGSKSLNDLLKNTRPDDPAAQFRLEVKMARLLRESPLPRPVRQHEVGRFHIDFAYPLVRLGIECEGFEYHGDRLSWKRDKRRAAWLEAQGWRIMFVTWDDVTKEPRQTLDRIAIALGSAAA
jgi:very-short-patch-repair endonuclease